jgi:hypothetical protein
MARTVVALYDDFISANSAVKELVENDFSNEDISVIASDISGEYGRYLDVSQMSSEEDTPPDGTAIGAGVGAAVGGLGGLLVGLGAFAIPGIGPVIAAGPLAGAISGLLGAGAGAVAGGLTGSVIGSLVAIGLPEESAPYYAEGIRRGGTLVSVKTADHQASQAMEILNRHGPVDVERRVETWREEGWQDFDFDASQDPPAGETGWADTGYLTEPPENSAAQQKKNQSR